MPATAAHHGTTSAKLTLNTGAAAGTILDPGLAAVGLGVLGDQRQAETGADAVAGRAAAGEALEDAHPLAARHARTGIVDRPSSMPCRP